MRGRSSSFACFRQSTGSSPSSSSQSPSPSPPEKVHIIRHPDFYFEDGSLVVLVENTLFRVFRSILTRHSTVFSDVFSLPPNTVSNTEGSSDDNPFILSGISCIDFERFLEALHPRKVGTYCLRSLDEWKSVLALSVRWDIESMCSLALRQIDALPSTEFDAVDRILLASQFDITGNWAFPAYMQLCVRAQALTGSEVSRLGPERTAQIAQIRERSMNLKKGFTLSHPGVASQKRPGTGSMTHNSSTTNASSKSVAPNLFKSKSASVTRPVSPSTAASRDARRLGNKAEEAPSIRPECFGNAKVASWVAATFSISPCRTPP